MKKPGNRSRARAGRPSGGNADGVRKALLEAARGLFLRYEFKAVSVRRIAEAAAVNPAMVHYYFGDKKGLYLAMVEHVFAPLKAELEALDERHELTVEDFVRLYAELMAGSPWWPGFIVREVLFGHGELREAVVERFRASVVPRLRHLIEEGQREGRFRTDLDPDLTLMSLIGLTVFPFLIRPMAKEVLDWRLEGESVDALVRHASTLFLQGVENPGEGRIQQCGLSQHGKYDGKNGDRNDGKNDDRNDGKSEGEKTR